MLGGTPPKSIWLRIPLLTVLGSRKAFRGSVPVGRAYPKPALFFPRTVGISIRTDWDPLSGNRLDSGCGFHELAPDVSVMETGSGSMFGMSWL